MINVAELFFVLRINILEISNENGVVGARRVSWVFIKKRTINEVSRRKKVGVPPIKILGVRARKYANITRSPPT